MQQRRRFIHGQAVRFAGECARMTRFRVYSNVDAEFLGLAELRDDDMLHRSDSWLSNRQPASEVRMGWKTGSLHLSDRKILT
jgi:hypothetical protein